ncbi:MAG: sulfotransferase domain-containing protein [Deltaproteobacteria bacterium]|nr:sulfotransferase domain-containing protein [Deltaproteobacteria bacterium]MBW2161427.1 sulfotransferase domain-containing protein [Deltaproteobacteria bacterium]
MRPTKTSTTRDPLQKTAGRVLSLATRALDVAVRNLDNARRIANFLRGRMEFEVRPTDVFISSYPRSGTTLTQWILYLLTHEEQPDPAHLTKVSPWFERSLAIGEVTASELERFPSPRVFKSHLPRQWLPDGARYIYVERDGLDVLVSYFHFYRAYLGFEGTLDDFYARFMDGRIQYGSWFEHVAGWRERACDPDVLIVRYEDLLSDRKASIERIIEFLGWARDERWVDRAVIESSFDAMKRRESVFDHATAVLLERGVSPESFLRAGQSGRGEGALSNAQVREIRERSSTGRRLAIRGLASFLQ